MARSVKVKSKVKSSGLTLEPHQIILRPIVTEKGTHLVERHNTYVFEVHPCSSKDQIKAAIEYLFEVKVASVNTQNRKGKTRRYRNMRTQAADWKRAIVTLSDDDRIALF